ncbi:MAG TPA: PfkB family carbohydrate kinase [Gemmatimonadaceae bacterium]|nr:PfkB family carbohydrate kinase [Gemmatimonadaceae bacterium]
MSKQSKPSAARVAKQSTKGDGRASPVPEGRANLLVVGSVALDSVETPFGRADNVLGGSGTFFSAAASLLAPVQLVGVVGKDYPMDQLEALAKRGVDLAGLERADGFSFRWRGRYRHDLNSAETLETHLGVFSHFSPKIPAQFRSAPFVFLANIDPRLQLDVLRQVDKPKLVACDTMNFWIESRRSDLAELLNHVDLITLNDGEARQLTDEFNLVRAARWILARGPRHVIIKKGEHGAFMFTRDSIFFAPAYPLESVFDPTGAGDAFAGGFMGYLARSGDLSEASLRRAMIYGSALGSFAVEKFSVQRLLELTPADVRARVAEFQRLVAFEAELDG